MRIAYLSGSIIPSNSANSIQVMRMCEAFTQQGHELVLVAQAGDNERCPFETYGVDTRFRIVSIPVTRSGWKAQWWYARQAAEAVRNFNPDVVYGRHLLSLYAAGAQSSALIYEVHQPASRWGRLIEGRLFRQRNFSGLTAISLALRDEYLRRFPALVHTNVQVLRSAARRELHTPKADSNSAAKRLKIGYTGHLYPGKGMETIERIAARLPTMDFHVLGGTPESVEQWRERVRHLPNVLLHGHVSAAEVAAWQREMDILILPCQENIRSAGGGDISAWTSPLKLFEYLATGLPVVASDIPAIREILVHNMNALLVTPDNIDGWVDTLKDLENSPEQRRSLGIRGRKWVQDGHTWFHRAGAVLQNLRPPQHRTHWWQARGRRGWVAEREPVAITKVTGE